MTCLPNLMYDIPKDKSKLNILKIWSLSLVITDLLK